MQATQELICACDRAHPLPINNQDVFDFLDELYDGRHINVDTPFEEIRDGSDFGEAHISAALYEAWQVAMVDDVCPYGDHHRASDCNTDCFEL